MKTFIVDPIRKKACGKNVSLFLDVGFRTIQSEIQTQFDVYQVIGEEKIMIFSTNPENEKEGAIIGDKADETNSEHILAKINWS